MRLFVAVWLPSEAVDAVAAVPRPDVAGLRWTTPDQWHVTLRFLGELPDWEPVARDLDARLREQPAVIARLGPRLGRFGRRILHVPVDGLDAPARAAGEEDLSFHGHVTLARARDRRGVDLRPMTAGACGPVEWLVDEVTLVRSRLGSGGARYEVVHRVPLLAS